MAGLLALLPALGTAAGGTAAAAAPAAAGASMGALGAGAGSSVLGSLGAGAAGGGAAGLGSTLGAATLPAASVGAGYAADPTGGSWLTGGYTPPVTPQVTPPGLPPAPGANALQGWADKFDMGMKLADMLGMGKKQPMAMPAPKGINPPVQSNVEPSATRTAATTPPYSFQDAALIGDPRLERLRQLGLA